MNQEDFKKRYVYDPAKDRLGEGGFGEVFKAYDTFLDQWIAIKISKVRSDFQDLRLKNEVDLLNKLPAHPNVARYEECHTFKTISGEHDFAILQYYESGNLLQVLKKQELSVSQKYYLLNSLLEGIRFIHSQGIIHRDLKPQNILIVFRDSYYIPKITDFGISKKLSFAKATQFSNSLIGAGTITYSSPEQLADQTIRKNSDLWSFGVIAFQVLTGETPFNSGTHSTASELGRQEMMNQISSGKLPDSINLIPIPWKQVIENCLIIDPSKRIKEVEDCISMLRGINQSETKLPATKKMQLEDDETQIVSAGNTKSKKRATDRKYKPLIIISLAGILVLAIIMISYLKSTPDTEQINYIQKDSLANSLEEKIVLAKIPAEIKPESFENENSQKIPENITQNNTSPKEGQIVFPSGNIYNGQLKDGKMHGKGKYWFKTGGLVSTDDPLERKAEAEDYIEGDWINGDLYKGYLFDKNGTKKERIVIGRN